MSINDFVVWLAGGGFIMAASFILERIPWYQKLVADVKDWVFAGVAAVIGCGAVALATYVPASVLTSLAPYFAVIFAVFSYIFLGKVFHNTDKKQENVTTVSSPAGSVVTTSTETPVK